MEFRQLSKIVGAAVTVGAIVFAGLVSNTKTVRAVDDEGNDESKIHRGFEVAPVPLNLDGKNRALVGLGSFIVNAQADCNGCHTPDPATEFAPGGNPYFGQPTKVNPATYLSGGQDFGPFPGPGSPIHIISRNLTPDKTGLPEGGHTFEEFRQIIRMGTDMDHLHPNLPPPFRGDLLQIMPWPVYRNMSDRELRAIYEYLSAIPCLEGSTDRTSPLHNDCG
jgi:hypothetical protein